jgi:hypothetical protein
MTLALTFAHLSLGTIVNNDDRHKMQQIITAAAAQSLFTKPNYISLAEVQLML